MTPEDATRLLEIFREDDSEVPSIDQKTFVDGYLTVLASRGRECWDSGAGAEPSPHLQPTKLTRQ